VTAWETAPEDPSASGPSGTARGADAWPPWAGPVALIAALVIASVGGVAVSVAATAFGYPLDGKLPPGALMAATAVQHVGFVVAAVLFARMAGPVWPEQFGLRGTRVLPAIGWMLAVFVGFAVFTSVWAQYVEVGGAEDQLDDLGIEGSDVALAFSALLVCVGAPVVEEFFFRGFFFRALRNWKGMWPAAVITGIVFGGIHFGSADAGALLPLAVFGFGLCLLYARTGSLYPCIALHAINNSIAFGTAVGWDWQVPLLVLASLVVCLGIAVAASRAIPQRFAVD
jgi:membrane protease YdiL (CAAX protease family)